MHNCSVRPGGTIFDTNKKWLSLITIKIKRIKITLLDRFVVQLACALMGNNMAIALSIVIATVKIIP